MIKKTSCWKLTLKNGTVIQTPEFSVQQIITQLKHQVIFDICSRHIKLGCKIKSISISDDFWDIDIDYILPGEVQMMKIEARFK